MTYLCYKIYENIQLSQAYRNTTWCTVVVLSAMFVKIFNLDRLVGVRNLGCMLARHSNSSKNGTANYP